MGHFILLLSKGWSPRLTKHGWRWIKKTKMESGATHTRKFLKKNALNFEHKQKEKIAYEY